MKILDAKKSVARLRVGSILIMFFSTVFFCCAALKNISFAMQGDTVGLSRTVQYLVYFVYERTQFISWIWSMAPVIDPRKINTAGNFGFLFILLFGVIGRLMWNSAIQLSIRISNTIKRVEEFGWEQALLAQQGIIIGKNRDILQINIELDQKEQWFKRPIGLLAMGIAIAVLGQWANLTFGLIK